MYFHSRKQAGQLLADELVKKYRYENCVVVAVDDGGVAVGAEIAARLHCSFTVTVSVEIDLPRELWAVGSITPDGQFVVNSQYSLADLEEIEQENRGYIEEQKISKMHEINRLVGDGGMLDKKVLAGHNVIFTSDGLFTPFKLDAAASFIKTVSYDKLIVATAIASVPVVDWMHIHADEIYCLSVLEDYMDVNHYYDIEDVPKHDKVIEILKSNIYKWH